MIENLVFLLFLSGIIAGINARAAWYRRKDHSQFKLGQEIQNVFRRITNAQQAVTK
jgi:hypothetical protein